MELSDKTEENNARKTEVEETKKNAKEGKLAVWEVLKTIEQMVNSFILKVKKFCLNIYNFLKSKFSDKEEVVNV